MSETYRYYPRRPATGRNPMDSEPTVQDEASEVLEEELIEEISIDGMCGVY